MAGPGRAENDGGGVRDDVNERSLFTPVAEVQALPVGRPAGTAPDNPATRDAAPHGKAPRTRLATVRQRLRRVSPATIRNGVTAAARTELDRGAAFLLVPVFLSVGVVGYFSLAGEPDFYRPAALALLLALVAWVARNRPKTHLCLLAALLCVLGFLAAKAETWRAATPMLGSEISTRLTGRVVAIDHMESGRVRLTLDVLSTARPTLRYAPERVRVSARALPKGARAGSTISGTVRLLPPTGPIRPGSYDYSFQSYFDGIGASGFFMSNPSLAEERPMPFSARLSAMVENAREAIAGHIRESVGGAEGEIAAALIVGVRAGIPEAVNEAMRKTGIYHIISISGLHMALVAGIVMAMMRGAFALFPDFSSRHAVKKIAAAVALLSVAAYLVISGVVVAAERSFIMLAVMLTAVLFDRAALTMRNLAISAIAVIAVSPHEVVGPSFQMSFAATAALVGAYAGWSDYRAGKTTASPPRRSLPGWLSRKFAGGMAGLAVTSIVAGGATTLYAMWHFQRVAPLSLLANLAIMPIVSAVVMPFAVLSSLAMPFGLDWPFLYVMGKGLSAMIVLAEWIAARSPVDAVGLVSGEAVLFVTIALVIATMATTWLRWAALPFALAGLLAIPAVRTPDVLVSEDGRLVALPIGGGELALNRPRASEFTIDNWRRALDAETVIAPAPAKASAFDLEDSIELPEGTPFLCADGLCVARHGNGPIVAHADSAAAAKPACAFAALIVIADATAADPCRDPLVAVVTARDLARSGSAEIFLDRQSAAAPAEIRYAVEENYRPWHRQRAFSREARGRPPYDAKAGRKTPRRQGIKGTGSSQKP
ncbi:ComEC/Rec2 family competence protein [Aquamicrobium soli]|uniref:ComEC/Rec2 family competence protein n=1 Tax=Aquamicrobium soli TaxID=1811518 RepID=A0ABV7KF42_9HYPH